MLATTHARNFDLLENSSGKPEALPCLLPAPAPLSCWEVAASATSPRPLTTWLAEIRQAWALGTAHTLELARLVSRARECLRHHGDWSRLWRPGPSQVPFSKRKADMLAAVGSALADLSEHDFAQMPHAWTTLYCLARLGRRTVECLIRENRIHPHLTLQEARDLLAQHQPYPNRNTRRHSMRQRFQRFADFVESGAPTWCPADQRFAHTELARLSEIVRSDLQSPSAEGVCGNSASPAPVRPRPPAALTLSNLTNDPA